ncbi:hypothetical protein FRC01_003408, partial [Tulasnella sp. 417]
MHLAERILSHDGLLATNLATAAASLAAVFALTKFISWRSSFRTPKPPVDIPEPTKETEAEDHPKEPEDSMSTEATATRPHRSSTLRAVLIPESSSSGSLEVPRKDSGNTGFAADDLFDVYSAYMRLLSDEL